MMALRSEQHDGRNVVEFRRPIVRPVEVASREVLPAADATQPRASSRQILLAWLGVIVAGLLIWAAGVMIALAYLP